jgi:hypothetical protein
MISDQRQIVWQTLAVAQGTGVIDDRQRSVVGMQIAGCVQ